MVYKVALFLWILTISAIKTDAISYAMTRGGGRFSWQLAPPLVIASK